VIVVIGGRIASGKSTLSAAVARSLRDAGRSAAIVELDLLYRAIEPDGPMDDQRLWGIAHRVAGAAAAAFIDQGIAGVVIDGLEPGHRAALLDGLPPGSRPLFVRLEATLAEAARRVAADPSRSRSRQREFLAAHYADRAHDLTASGDLVIDTVRLSVDEAARQVVERCVGGRDLRT
jgi:chloramphenicol 3-O-phosphotransferase